MDHTSGPLSQWARPVLLLTRLTLCQDTGVWSPSPSNLLGSHRPRVPRSWHRCTALVGLAHMPGHYSTFGSGGPESPIQGKVPAVPALCYWKSPGLESARFGQRVDPLNLRFLICKVRTMAT